MIPKECLEMTVKEYRKWQKENIRCDKCKEWKRRRDHDMSWGNCDTHGIDMCAGDFCSYFEAK